jgi:hypothetical protein
MVVIEVPWDHNAVLDIGTFPNSAIMLTPEFITWVESRNIKYTLVRTNSGICHCFECSKAVFSFQDPKDAMLFKLTWS